MSSEVPPTFKKISASEPHSENGLNGAAQGANGVGPEAGKKSQPAPNGFAAATTSIDGPKVPQIVTSGPSDGSKPSEAGTDAVSGEGTNRSQPQEMSSTAPIGTRKLLRKKHVKKKRHTKIVWTAGHLMNCFFGLTFAFIYFFDFRHRHSLYPRFAYRMAFLGLIIAYSITSFKKFGAQNADFYTLITTENFQYLLLGVVWLFTRPSVFKFMPYFIISVLQMAQEFGVLKHIPQLAVIGMAKVISYNEIMLMIVLLGNTLLFRGTSGYALMAFGLFYWLRIVYSELTKAFFLDIAEVFGDRVILKCPENVQNRYSKIIRSVEARSAEVERIFAKIRDQKIKGVEDKIHEEGENEEDKVGDSGFATGVAGGGGGEVKIDAGEKEPEKKK